VEGPAGVPDVWREQGVRGRTLVLFDDYPLALLGSTGEPAPANFVGWGIRSNVVRRVYLVIPDDRWEEFQRRRALYLAYREVPGNPGAIYLFTFSGVPLVAVTPSSLPALDEDALVVVNLARFELRDAAGILARRRIGADVLVAIQGTRG
jgi:hypothetical protein